MLSVLYFWLGLSPGFDLVTAGLGLEAKNYGIGLGLVDMALTSALASCTYGLVNIPGDNAWKSARRDTIRYKYLI